MLHDLFEPGFIGILGFFGLVSAAVIIVDHRRYKQQGKLSKTEMRHQEPISIKRGASIALLLFSALMLWLWVDSTGIYSLYLANRRADILTLLPKTYDGLFFSFFFLISYFAYLLVLAFTPASSIPIRITRINYVSFFHYLFIAFSVAFLKVVFGYIVMHSGVSISTTTFDVIYYGLIGLTMLVIVKADPMKY
jgi:hypothetical protein